MENFKRIKSLLEVHEVDKIVKELIELSKIRELEKGEKYNLEPLKELVKNIRLENENYFDNHIKETLENKINKFYEENKEEFTEIYNYDNEEINAIRNYLGDLSKFNSFEEFTDYIDEWLDDMNIDYIDIKRECKIEKLVNQFLEDNEIYKDLYNEDLDVWDYGILDSTDLEEQITKTINSKFYELVFIDLTYQLEYCLEEDLVIYPKQDENFNTEGAELGEIAENIVNYIYEEEYNEELLNSDNIINDLIFSQDYTLKDLKDYFNGLSDKHSIFLESLINELENTSFSSTFLGYMLKVGIKDYFKIKEGKIIKYNNGILGLVDIVNGGGSLLNIKLEKPVVIKHNTDDYFDTIQIEGINTYGYSVKDIYDITEISADYEILG